MRLACVAWAARLCSWRVCAEKVIKFDRSDGTGPSLDRELARSRYCRVFELQQSELQCIAAATGVIQMAQQKRTFDCANCGATVVVEIGAYLGGPFAYDDYAKCKNCGREYSNQAEIGKLVAVKRALQRENTA